MYRTIQKSLIRWMYRTNLFVLGLGGIGTLCLAVRRSESLDDRTIQLGGIGTLCPAFSESVYGYVPADMGKTNALVLLRAGMVFS